MNQVEIIIAGFGGQGILSSGKMIAQAGMIEGKNVSWVPSYGPEMRGGTSNCHVIVSENPVGSPILNECDVLIAMNGPSLEKFEKSVVPGGLIIVDSSLVENKSKRTDIEFVGIPATQMASDMGNLTYAGIIILGKLLAKTEVVSNENFEAALKKILPKKKHHLIPEEMKALEMGANY
jgi:2-oxoglutarate ferredoxin oxidoreductase subunit gamma